MGTWSHEPFGNDAADDRAFGLEDSRRFSPVEVAARQAVAKDGCFDADTAMDVIAAAELLARAMGRGMQSDACLQPVDDWVAGTRAAPSAELRALACQALVRGLGDDSELRGLRQERDAFDDRTRSAATLQYVRTIRDPAHDTVSGRT